MIIYSYVNQRQILEGVDLYEVDENEKLDEN